MKIRRLVLALCLALPLLMMASDAARPWTFWYWMYGAVSREGIKADLESMKNVGLGGCYLMPIRGSQERVEYRGTAEQLSPDFWEKVDYAMTVADSLGLQMGIHVCDGFALAGGPWISPAESMQKVVFCDTVVKGNLHHLELKKPESFGDYYEDIAAFAVPADAFPCHSVASPRLVDQSASVWRNEKGVLCADSAAWLLYDFGSSACLRNVEIEPSGTNIQCQRLKIESSEDGESFRFVKQLEPARQGWQNAGYNTTFAFRPTRARYWRLSWSPEGSEPGSEDLDAAKWKPVLRMKSIRFSGFPRIHQWEGKAGFVWRIAPETSEEELPTADCVPLNNLIRLEMEGDRIASRLKSSTYYIIRMGHTSTGHTNATAGGGKGLECDKFSRAAVNKQIDNWFAKFAALGSGDSLQNARRSASNASSLPFGFRSSSPLKYLHVDSWECGSQNWSSCFADEFKARRGYDLLPYLPVMAGIPVESAEKSEQVLRDVRLTINDLINEVFFVTVRNRAHEMGMQFSSESVAPTMVSDGLEHYKYADLPMGEFWLNSPTHDKPNDMLDAISGAHIYGNPVVQAEGFTEVRGVWDETPAMLKPLLDRHFALGMNKLFFHVTAHNPWMDRKPGMTLDGIGLFFQRDNTWFCEARGFVDYVTRCQEILQSGRSVVDIAVFTGEEMPSRAVLPDRLVPMLPGLFGKARVEKERKRLENAGQPMEESPVGVRHSAGITGAEDWINPLRGYHYDSMNRDVLLNLASVEDSCIILPGGARYRVLVIPRQNPMNPSLSGLSEAVKRRVEEFRKAGVIIIDKPYEADDFSQFGLERDAILPENIAYTHILISGFGDYYFLSNQENREQTFTVSLRGSGYRGVVLVDAVTGRRSNPLKTTVVGRRTEVELTLPAYGSVFVERSNGKQVAVAEKALKGKSMTVEALWDVEFIENGIRTRTGLPHNWAENLAQEMRYYSGKAVYRAPFNFRKRGVGCVSLSVGEVHDVAHVYVNDVDCGVIWTAPYEVEVPVEALHEGKNELRIEVVNTWHNALRGADANKPPYAGIWTNAKYRTKGDSLQPAGLFGPVVIKY
ncbi:MAG: DNA-binding protein [Prevotella sp.]|nr:DNA-binding protein [Prevotella sp.]